MKAPQILIAVSVVASLIVGVAIGSRVLAKTSGKFMVRKPSSNSEVTLSPFAHYRKVHGGGYILVLIPDFKNIMAKQTPTPVSVIDSLEQLQQKEKIKSAFFYGIGMVQNTIIGHLDPSTFQYVYSDPDQFKAPAELISLTGNMSWDRGPDGTAEPKPKIHAHVAIGSPTNQTFGGHLLQADVAATVEVFISTQSEMLERTYLAPTTMSYLDLSK